MSKSKALPASGDLRRRLAANLAIGLARSDFHGSAKIIEAIPAGSRREKAVLIASGVMAHNDLSSCIDYLAHGKEGDVKVAIGEQITQNLADQARVIIESLDAETADIVRAQLHPDLEQSRHNK